MNKKQRKILITSALPYANGMLHLGHILEVIQTDIFCRFQKLKSNECYYVCADDAHGTPIMLKAMEFKIPAEQLIAKFHQLHLQDFAGFYIDFDYFHSTHSKENQFFSETIFNKLKKQGLIYQKEIEGAFDPEKQMFLPDRFVKGTCPKCKATDQYGDNCEVCGSTYQIDQLINPRSLLSNKAIILKKSIHLFFKLTELENYLKEYIKNTAIQKSIKNKLKEWFNSGLQDWDISRDAPYFGFEIPGFKDKFFYVWLDAPIGYMASFKKLCDSANKTKLKFDHFWQQKNQTKTELYHFIGKDIVYFHILFWPAMLYKSDFRVPTNIFVHGFLTINGEKMSKSRGTFIQACDYLKVLDAEYLRYYFACKLNNQVEDIDLNLDDFKSRVNADLIGKLINIASRSTGLLNKYFAGLLASELASGHNLIKQIQSYSSIIENHYEQRNYSKITSQTMLLADKVNQYLNEQAPWQMLKNENEKNKAHQVLSTALNAYLILIIYLKPILPKVAEKTEKLMNLKTLNWADSEKIIINHKINPYKAILNRIEDEQINKLTNS